MKKFAFLFLFVAAEASAQTLVSKKDGKIVPAAAKSWTTGKDSVSFVLADGVDGAAVAKLLSERLATAKVAFAGGKVEVSGVSPEALLEQLTTLSLSGEGADPLADLAGLGTVVAMETPEGGGSIRASKPTAGARPRPIKDHDPSERVAAQVVEVQRGAFPLVALKIRIIGPPKAGVLKGLKKGTVIDAPVVLAGEGNIDLQSAATQRNIGAYYLSAGDQISVHAVSGEGNAIEIDWVERAKK